MLPLPIVSAFFVSSLVAALTAFSRTIPSNLTWFILFYFVCYRVKVFLDDWHYYEDSTTSGGKKFHEISVTSGDGLWAISSWIISLAVAIQVGAAAESFFRWLAINFAVNEGWIIWSASVRIHEVGYEKYRRQFLRFHGLWFIINLFPIALGFTASKWLGTPNEESLLGILSLAWLVDSGVSFQAFWRQPRSLNGESSRALGDTSAVIKPAEYTSPRDRDAKGAEAQELKPPPSNPLVS
jgi:hypothetical protein